MADIYAQSFSPRTSKWYNNIYYTKDTEKNMRNMACSPNFKQLFEKLEKALLKEFSKEKKNSIELNMIRKTLLQI